MSSNSSPGARLFASAACALIVWIADDARAQCTPDPAMTGDTVNCVVGTDPDGFAAGAGVDMLTIDLVRGAIINNSPGQDGILVNDDNFITNDGFIDVTGVGVAGIRAGSGNDNIVGSGTAEGIINTWSIQAVGDNSFAIIAADNNTIDNRANISVDGANAVGIQFGSDNVSTTFQNGFITISGDGATGYRGLDNNIIVQNGRISTLVTSPNAIGIDLRDGDPGDNTLFSIVNSGSGDIDLSGAGVVGIRTRDHMLIRNSGEILLDGDGALGVDVGSNNLVFNDGTQGLGIIDITGDNSFGVRAGDGSTLLNSGDILATGVDSFGVSIGTTAGADTEVDNFGTIEGGSGNGAGVTFGLIGSGTRLLLNQSGGLITALSGVAVIGSSGNDEVQNDGRIDGSLQLGAGTDRVENRTEINGDVLLGSGNDSFDLATGARVNPFGTDTGQIDGGTGVDAFTLSGAFVGAFTLDQAVGFETLDIDAGTPGFGGVWTLSGDGAFPQGTTLTNGGLALSGTVGLTGDFVQQPGTTLFATINPDGTSDRLDVVGSASINGGELSLFESAPITTPTTFTLLTATGGVSGAFDSVVAPMTGAGLTFSTIFGPNEIQATFSGVPFATLAATENQVRTGNYIDRVFAAGPSPTLTSLINELRALDVPSIQAALDQLHPEAYDAHTSVALSSGRRFTQMLAGRPELCLQRSAPLGRRLLSGRRDCVDHSWQIWTEALGHLRERNGGGGQIDTDDGGITAAFGLERAINENLVIGGSLAATRTHINVHNVGNGSHTGFDAGVFAGAAISGLRLRGVASYGHGWHDQRRNIKLPGLLGRTARSSHQSDRVGAMLEAGWAFEAGHWTFEPQTSIDYQFVREQKTGESGAGDFNLHVLQRNSSTLTSRFGGRVSTHLVKYRYITQFLEAFDGVWTSEIHAHWRKVWTGHDRKVAAFMPAAPAAAGLLRVSAKDAEHGLEAGAGLVFQPSNSLVALGLHYDVFYGDGNLGHLASARLTLFLP